MYAAHIPASYRADMFISRDHFVAMRKHIWILASFNIPKERGNLKGQSSVEPWKFLNGNKHKVLGDDFFMKHSVELAESGSEILPRIELCEKVPHHKMCYVDERSGLERSVVGWFRSTLEMFSREQVVSKESSWDLWAPIVNKDVVKVDHADCNLKKARYSSTKKLFMAEIEKKERLVWIPKKSCDTHLASLDLNFFKRRRRFQLQD